MVRIIRVFNCGSNDICKRRLRPASRASRDNAGYLFRPIPFAAQPTSPPQHRSRARKGVFDRAIGKKTMIGPEDYSHSLVPGQPLEAENRPMRGHTCNGDGALFPASVQIVVPQVRHVAFDSVNGSPRSLGFLCKCAARGKPFVENHLVQGYGRLTVRKGNGG